MQMIPPRALWREVDDRSAFRPFLWLLERYDSDNPVDSRMLPHGKVDLPFLHPFEAEEVRGEMRGEKEERKEDRRPWGEMQIEGTLGGICGIRTDVIVRIDSIEQYLF